MTIENADFWSACRDDERLKHETPQDAIEAWYDDIPTGEVSPSNISLYAFRRMVPNLSGGEILDCLSNSRLSDYLDPDGEPDFSAEIERAADKLAALLQSGPHILACKCIGSEVFNIAEYIP